MAEIKDGIETTELDCECVGGIPDIEVVFKGNVGTVSITVNHFHEDKETKEE